MCEFTEMKKNGLRFFPISKVASVTIPVLPSTVQNLFTIFALPSTFSNLGLSRVVSAFIFGS